MCWINSQCLAIPDCKERLPSWCPGGGIQSGTIGSMIKMGMCQARFSPRIVTLGNKKLRRGDRGVFLDVDAIPRLAYGVVTFTATR